VAGISEEEARARVNARHAERARKRARALVEDSLWLLEVGGCSFAEIIARTGHRSVGSYAAALRRAGRLDVLYRVRRDHAALAEWRAERERKWRRRYEEANREARRAANRERMRRVRATTRVAAEAQAWELRKLTAATAERFDLMSVGAEAEDAQEARRMYWTPDAREALGELCALLDRELSEAGERARSLSREEAS
jgi:hypothetical protein